MDISVSKAVPLAALMELGDLIQQKRREQRRQKPCSLSQNERRDKLEEWRWDSFSQLTFEFGGIAQLRSHKSVARR